MILLCDSFFALVENGPFIPVHEAHLSRLPNRDRWGSTWPLRLAQAGGPFVPVGATNRDQKASTRQQLMGWVFCFFLKWGGWGFGGFVGLIIVLDS